MRRLWVVAISEGTELRFAPEVYPTQLRASREAYRWRWFLSRSDETKVRELAENHWRIGRSFVHLGPATMTELPDKAEIWVGYQTKGATAPFSFALFHNRNDARNWVRSGSVHMRRGGREHAMYSRNEYGSEKTILWAATYQAKVCASYDAAVDVPIPEPTTIAEYEVDLTATFSHAIHAFLRSDPGLKADGVGEIVEREFPHLMTYRGALLEANWELDDFKEIRTIPPAQKPRPQSEG